MIRNTIGRLLAVTALVAWTVVPALAQTTGTLSGVVRDSTGAAVPGASVTVVNQQTGVGRTVVSGADGSFSVPDLPAGAYAVSVDIKGFRNASQRDVQVAAGGTAKTEFTLEAGLEEAVTVTGTRVKGRTSTETSAPVDIIDSETIRSTGATETGKILQLLEPSFNFSTTTISDGTDIIRPATLRSLGPDQVLVLINGKRYHQQSLMHYQQTIARGSAGYDINSIPASSIDRIEVLRDGASAQYGSDAIAGVINVILKKQPRTTDFTFETGQFYADNPTLPLGASPDASSGHGAGFMGAVNTGLGFGNGGFVNLDLEYRDRGETNRASTDVLRVDPARVTQRIGDPEAKDFLAWVNAGTPLGQGNLYAFGGYSYRKGDSSGFFRSAGDNRTVPELYPNGFLPTIRTQPSDYQANVGYLGVIGDSGWTWDLSGSYGKSKFQFNEENTVNVSWFYEPLDRNDPTGPKFNQSPTEADTGALGYDQLAFNLDLTKVVGWGVGAGPLNVAAGAEWRQEGYEIIAGDPVSYTYGRTNDPTIPIVGQTGDVAPIGAQGFPGYSPREAVDENRDNIAFYVDLESQLSRRFLAGVAGRYEHYSDFGSTVTGKFSARYNFTDRFALRGTISNGFRAPGVQQLFYNSRSTNLNAAGVLTDTLTARQDSAVTRAFGIPPLKEETSINYTLGLVARTGQFRLTVDGYRIDIDDRIIFSSNIQPDNGGPISQILAPFSVGQVQFFTNAIDTKTQGVDVVGLYDIPFEGGSVLGLEAALSFNKTEVQNIRSSSPILPPNVLFDRSQVTLIEEGQPRQHHLLGVDWRRGGWNANVRFNYFGEVSGEGFTPRTFDSAGNQTGGFKQTWGSKWITDLSVTAPLVKDKVTLTVGALNLFDVYPDDWHTACPGTTFLQGCAPGAINDAFPFPQLGFQYGWETLPFGINGGYYYARVNIRLNH